MKDLSAAAWNDHYLEGITPWDLQGPCPQILEFTKEPWFSSTASILLPGAGRGHDAIALASMGHNVSAVDFAPGAIKALLQQAKEKKQNVHVFQRDFFSLSNDPFHKERYDIIIEYTFFCAIDPKLRANYIKLAHQLLRPNGYFAGIFFPTTNDKEPPPFVVDREEVLSLFKEGFTGEICEPNISIKPRKGREFLGIFKKTKPQ
ncbi:MAG: TPMT family class I SAM-dependent methyltransferase [Oligoflexia bacterium]|nr:TPMT family class I SAM-dependent methyltransferase [Oligoflexia bacterium]